MSWSTKRAKVPGDAVRAVLSEALEQEKQATTPEQQKQSVVALDAAEAGCDALTADGESAEFDINIGGHAGHDDSPGKGDSLFINISRTA